MKNQNLTIWLIAIGAIILVIGLVSHIPKGRVSRSDDAPPTSTANELSSSISDGTIILSYSEKDFGLATNQEQVLVKSYIPPCDTKFSYCLYYVGGKYAGTNFESAGLRISKRADLASERSCLNDPPAGFSSDRKPDASTTTARYSSSAFSKIGDAAAGHYANGSLYRVFYRSTGSCYEFETRIGQSQFMNYPTGSIKEFTAADQASLASMLDRVLDSITLQSGDTGLFLH
jgi:hypothetical protein